jgi:hypothetical protein
MFINNEQKRHHSILSQVRILLLVLWQRSSVVVSYLNIGKQMLYKYVVLRFLLLIDPEHFIYAA